MLAAEVSVLEARLCEAQQTSDARLHEALQTSEARLHEAQQTSDAQFHEALQAAEDKVSRYRSAVDQLEADKATLAQDLQLNLAQMVKAMTSSEARYQAARTQLEAVLNSNSWKATLPLQRFARTYPSATRAIRGIMTVSRRTLGMRAWMAEVVRSGVDNLTAPLRPSSAQALKPSVLAAEPQDPGNATIWPKESPLVSVIIPCFNYGHFVSEAIKSVLGQTFADVEIIVIEGGSSLFKSRHRVAELNYPRTRVLLQDTANRAGENRNFGIRHARGKYICCLDADDRLEPTYLEKALFLLEHYEYDVVSTALKFFGQRSNSCAIIERPVLADMLKANHVLTCAVFRRDLWAKAGGFRDFDASEGHVHEDWAFWMRLAGLGARFWNIAGECLFLYRSHSSASLSNKDVIPLERQGALMKVYNADVLGPGAVERSSELAAEERRALEPLRNLARGPSLNEDRRSILVALPFTIIGGAETLLSCILKHLKAKGWRVTVVTTVPIGEEHGDTTDWFRGATSEIYHLPRFLAPSRWDDYVRYLLEAKNVDILWIVGSAYFYGMIPDLKARHPRLKIVDLLFNTVGHTANNRKHARSIDLNIVENREVLAWLIKRGEADSRIKVIESGVDLESHAPRQKDPLVIEQLGIAEDTLIVGFSGRWSEEKDPIGFIEIARRTRPEGIVFVMTGTGHMRPQIEAAIAAARFPPGRFHLVGAVPEIAPYVSSYDILCLPSRQDGRPVVVLEALAMGVPVVSSRVGALPELVEDGVNGYLLAAGDYDSFAHKIGDMAASRDKLRAMKLEARRGAVCKLDARKMLTEYEAALSNVCGVTTEPRLHLVNGSANSAS